MNHMKARQRAKDQKFDYTCENDGRVYPVGYCCGWREWDDTTKAMHPAAYEKAKSFQEKYHTNGHDSEQEACECYKEYLLDQRTQLNRKHENAQYQCRVCGAWTQLYAQVDGWDMFNLCEEHQTVDDVWKYLHVYESFES